MRQFLKTILEKTLRPAGAFPCGMTKPEAVRNLIQQLFPLETSHSLIRLGPNGDGGYLVPNDLSGISCCFSPGVSNVSGFERDCAERGIDVYLADKSVDGPADVHQRFHFTKKFLGATSNQDFMTIDSWVDNSPKARDGDLILQIDIEGYEYEVFLSASDALLRRFRIIVAEFHYLDQFWNRPFFSLAEKVFRKVLQTHACVHIHPNNSCGKISQNGLTIPRAMEFTFYRKDRAFTGNYMTQFPSPLDSNNTSHPSMPLPSCWYASERRG
jgi:hypothetical protein